MATTRKQADLATCILGTGSRSFHRTRKAGFVIFFTNYPKCMGEQNIVNHPHNRLSGMRVPSDRMWGYPRIAHP